jgi:hypothetical protein
MKPSNKSTSKSQGELFSFDIFLLNEGSQYTYVQNLLVRRQSSWIIQSREHEVMSHCGKSMNTLDIFFLATQLWCSSIIDDLSNAEWLKYHLSNLRCDVNVTTAHPRPWRNRCCTCRLLRHPQDGGYNRSTPGALPLATKFKCKFVAQITSLSSSEPLAGAASAADGSTAAEKEAVTGEPGSGRHNNKLICSWPSVSCFGNECTAFKLKRASRVQAGQRAQAGRPGAGRNNAVAHRMYSDVRVCTNHSIYGDTLLARCISLYILVYTEIHDFLEFHTEFYGSIVELMMYWVYLSIYPCILVWARWSGFQMS